MRFLVRLLINAAALWVALKLVSGITYSSDNWVPFFGVALIFGIVNSAVHGWGALTTAVLCPILAVATCKATTET